jgi:hypothetical protein
LEAERGLPLAEAIGGISQPQLQISTEASPHRVWKTRSAEKCGGAGGAFRVALPSGWVISEIDSAVKILEKSCGQ